MEIVKKYLLDQNRGPTEKLERQKTLVLMDATGSMGGLLTKAKATVEEMFRRACEILKSKGYDEDSF